MSKKRNTQCVTWPPINYFNVRLNAVNIYLSELYYLTLYKMKLVIIAAVFISLGHGKSDFDFLENFIR